MAYLRLDTYRSKGINAYLIPIDTDINFADYGKPDTEEDLEKSYKGKSHTVVFDLSSKKDGGYKYKCANGHKSQYGWLLIKSGEIIEEFVNEQDLRKALNPLVLPTLEGTEKQIVWAEKIRLDFIQSIGDQITDWDKGSAAYEGLVMIQSAKTWIDNRDKLNPSKFVAKVRDMEKEWKAAEEYENLQDAIQKEESVHRITRDDEVRDEVDIYAIVYSDRIEVIANILGAGEKIPKGRKYIGTKGDMKWQYDLSKLDEIKSCGSIDFILDEAGNKIDE